MTAGSADDRAAGPDPHGSSQPAPPPSGAPPAGSPRTGHPQPSVDGEGAAVASAEVEEVEGETGAPDGAAPGDSSASDDGELSVEGLVSDLERVARERDEYLSLAQAKQAEFENFRKRMMKQQAEEVARASARLVDSLLPVLDAFDYGIAHGDDSLVPMRGQLLGALEKEGLARLDPEGSPFDPNEHEAVAHEPGEGGGPEVAEVLRAGYRWQGHLLRPAMVRVRD